VWEDSIVTDLGSNSTEWPQALHQMLQAGSNTANGLWAINNAIISLMIWALQVSHAHLHS